MVRLLGDLTFARFVCSAGGCMLSGCLHASGDSKSQFEQEFTLDSSDEPEGSTEETAARARDCYDAYESTRARQHMPYQ